MSKVKELGPLFTAGVFLFSGLSFLVVFIALLLAGFNSMLNTKIEPIKENQARFERRLDRIETKLDQVLIQKKAMAK